MNYSKGDYSEDDKFIITLDDINAVCALNIQAEPDNNIERGE